MLKETLKISGIILIYSFLTACSGHTEKKIDYEMAKSMPGYGYITLDFRKSKEIDYGRNFVPGKTGYRILYFKDGHLLSVHVDKANYENRKLIAYIPYMKGYKLYSISRIYWFPRKSCENCESKPDTDFVDIYTVDSFNNARCEEATYKNNQTYEHFNGCKNMEWMDNQKKMKGSILITPHFQPSFNGMFTPYLKPGHSTAGS